MNRKNRVVTKTAVELAKTQELSPAGGAEIGLRREFDTKIIEEMKRPRLKHAEVAGLARTSRTRVMAVLNRNTKDISTDLLLPVLYALGWTARVRFTRAA